WEIPSESERRVFVQRLLQFRGTLSPREQRLLDSLLTARNPRGDVHGYSLLDSTDRLTAILLGLLEQLGQSALGVGEQGQPTNILPPEPRPAGVRGVGLGAGRGPIRGAMRKAMASRRGSPLALRRSRSARQTLPAAVSPQNQRCRAW